MKEPENPHLDSEIENSGSPKPGEPLFLAIGKLLRPHGLEGLIPMAVWTDFPERITSGKVVFLGKKYQPVTIESFRPHQQNLLIKLAGIDDRDHAGLFTNLLVYIRNEDLPALPDGEYYHHQLLGMNVVDQQGLRLGTLVDILETGSNDVYVVRNEADKEILLPAIQDVILEISLAKAEMVVNPPDWYNE